MKLHLTPVLLAALAILPACRKDDDDPEPLQSKVYTGRTELAVTYNGTDMAGKSVAVTPDGGNASFACTGSFDMAQLGGAFKDMEPLQTAGVLPGSPLLQLTLPISADGSGYSFSHSGETDFVTYKLAGRVDASKLEANFTDVALKNQTFANTAWAPVKASGLPAADTQPIRIVWETQMPVQIPGLQYGMQDILRILVNAHLIPVYNGTANMSLTQVIENGLRTLAFNGDGNIPVTYLQTANGASVFTLAPKCMFQYVPLSDQAILLYVNPTDLLSLVLLNNSSKDPDIPENPWGKTSRTEPSFQDLLGNLAKALLPMLPKGIPMSAVRTADGMQLYIGSETLLPLLKQVIVPLLMNPVTKGLVQDYVDSHAELAQYADAIMLAYDALPLLLSQTTRLEFGLNLTKAE